MQVAQGQYDARVYTDPEEDGLQVRSSRGHDDWMGCRDLEHPCSMPS
jgi:hypothetical protein